MMITRFTAPQRSLVASQQLQQQAKPLETQISTTQAQSSDSVKFGISRRALILGGLGTLAAGGLVTAGVIALDTDPPPMVATVKLPAENFDLTIGKQPIQVYKDGSITNADGNFLGLLEKDGTVRVLDPDLGDEGKWDYLGNTNPDGSIHIYTDEDKKGLTLPLNIQAKNDGSVSQISPANPLFKVTLDVKQADFTNAQLTGAAALLSGSFDQQIQALPNLDIDFGKIKSNRRKKTSLKDVRKAAPSPSPSRTSRTPGRVGATPSRTPRRPAST